MPYPLQCPKCGENVVERVSTQIVTEKGYIDSDGDFVFTESVGEEIETVDTVQCRICQAFYKENE